MGPRYAIVMVPRRWLGHLRGDAMRPTEAETKDAAGQLGPLRAETTKAPTGDIPSNLSIIVKKEPRPWRQVTGNSFVALTPRLLSSTFTFMAQRNSEYERKPRDLYETPEWASKVILEYIPYDALIWEPACASGKMARAVYAQWASDLVTDYGVSGADFLKTTHVPEGCNCIITNPPFGRNAQAFIEHGLELLQKIEDPTFHMAMLLPINFDAAMTRSHLFGQCKFFRTKVVLTRRIVWIERTDGIKEAPSENHAWFLWSNASIDPPTIRYYYP